MCDLWQNTLTETLPVGAIPAQIDYALEQCRAGIPPAVKTLEDQERIGRRHDAIEQCSKSQGSRDARPALRQIKLYNSGSFFDPRAVPPGDYVAISSRVCGFERVIVECHPALVGDSVLKFRDLLNATNTNKVAPFVHRPTPGPSQEGNSEALVGWHSLPGGDGRGLAGVLSYPSSMESSQAAGQPTKLEVAMGLETAHPQVLEKLNKRMTLDQFHRAAEFLRANNIALRVFVLVKPPFLDEAEALHWANRSMDFAFDCGATAVSLIPTRLGNGALEALALHDEFSPPKMATLEAALEYGIGLKRERVFADLWDLEKFSDCEGCFEGRRGRLHEMNLRQITQPRVACDCSREGSR
jgi:hypothetical protein